MAHLLTEILAHRSSGDIKRVIGFQELCFVVQLLAGVGD